jgi:hypothetical protein
MADVVTGVLDRHAQDAGFGNFQDMLAKVCQRVMSKAQCVSIGGAFKRTLNEDLGQPFTCSAASKSASCTQTLEDLVGYAEKHLSVALGACVGICLEMEFQYDTLQFVVGFGPLPGGGLSLKWNQAPVDEQANVNIEGCFGAAVVGGCVGGTARTDEDGYWLGGAMDAGVSLGEGEFSPLVGYQFAQIDFNDAEGAHMEWFPDPLPAGIERYVEYHCGTVWWC